jgi:hypothetical protein
MSDHTLKHYTKFGLCGELTEDPRQGGEGEKRWTLLRFEVAQNNRSTYMNAICSEPLGTEIMEKCRKGDTLEISGILSKTKDKSGNWQTGLSARRLEAVETGDGGGDDGDSEIPF